MNKSMTKVIMENDTPIYVKNTQVENMETTFTWDRDTAPETKKQDKDIQRRITVGWPSFIKHRDLFKGNIGTCLRRGNKGTHHPCKEQASSHTNKDGKEYVIHYILKQKNKHLGNKKDKGHRRD